MLEQKTKPLCMFESAGLSILFKHLEAVCHAVKAKLVQQIKSRMSKHVMISFQLK
jgi:hypothetical protein